MISASRGREFFLSGEPGEELAVRHLREPLLLLYTGEDWEEPAIINSPEQVRLVYPWLQRAFIQLLQGLTTIDKEE